MFWGRNATRLVAQIIAAPFVAAIVAKWLWLDARDYVLTTRAVWWLGGHWRALRERSLLVIDENPELFEKRITQKGGGRADVRRRRSFWRSALFATTIGATYYNRRMMRAAKRPRCSGCKALLRAPHAKLCDRNTMRAAGGWSNVTEPDCGG